MLEVGFFYPTATTQSGDRKNRSTIYEPQTLYLESIFDTSKNVTVTTSSRTIASPVN